MNQSDLIKRCQFGDKQAFEELYHLYCNQALKTAYLISGQRGIAEDIVQEAFIQCFKEIKQLKTVDNFYSWFYKILIRCGWRMITKYKNMTLIANSSEHYENVVDRSFCLDDLMELREINAMVQQALLKLKIPMRAVVTLYYYDDMTISEIASVLGCFQGTVKSRLHNAKKFLGKELKQCLLNGDSLGDKNNQKESIVNG